MTKMTIVMFVKHWSPRHDICMQGGGDETGEKMVESVSVLRQTICSYYNINAAAKNSNKS